MNFKVFCLFSRSQNRVGSCKVWQASATLVFAALLFSAACAEAAPKIFWHSPQGGSTLVKSTGQPWDKDFKFELGVFKNNFQPTAVNTDQWAANWVPAQRAGYNIGSERFTATYTVSYNVAPFVANAKPYIWGFSGSETAGEWFLATGTNNWKWPSYTDILNPDFSTVQASAVVGTINGGPNYDDAPFHIKTAAITNAMPPATSWPDWATEALGQVPAGPSGDLNTNKITDVWEYALHADALVPGMTPNTSNWLQIAEASGDQFLEIHIPRRRDRPATYTVEVTSDLVNGPWVSGVGVTEIVANSPAELVVRDKTPIGQGADRRFMRVKISAGS